MQLRCRWDVEKVGVDSGPLLETVDPLGAGKDVVVKTLGNILHMVDSDWIWRILLSRAL